MQFTPTEALVFEKKIIELGYIKYQNQNFNNSDFCYWKKYHKNVDEDGEKIYGYQIGLAFYDFTQYHPNFDLKPISVSFHLILGNNAGVNRLDVTLSDEKLTLEEFEKFSKTFFKLWNKKKKKSELLINQI